MQRIYVDRQPIDLRIANPFPTLENFCIKFDLEGSDEYNHKHYPYIVFLYRALKTYGKIPAKSSEENELKEIIKKMGRFSDEENLDEAIIYKFQANKDSLNVSIINN